MDGTSNRKFGGYKVHIIFSLIMAIIGTLQIYPFIGLADGFSRWKLALEICDSGEITSETLLSPIIPYFQALTYKLTNSYAFYTVIQAFLFYVTIGILVESLIGKEAIKMKNVDVCIWNIVAFVLVLFPTVYVFPLMLTDSAPIFILIVCLFWIHNNVGSEWIRGILTTLFTFICVGIRINSLILFGVVALYYLLRWIKSKELNNGIIVAMVLMSSLAGIVMPSSLTPGTYNAASLGMIWELTGIVSEDSDGDLASELERYGDVDEAVKRYGDPYLNSIVWDNNPPFPAYHISGEYSSDIIKLYINEALTNPCQFLKNKIKFIGASLGITNQLITSQRGIHDIDEKTKSYGALDTVWQHALRKSFIGVTDGIGFLSLRPFIAILISFALIGVLCIEKQNVTEYFELWGIAVAYYSSFLINTQAHEYRYYAPSFYILFGIIICAIVKSTLCKANKKK